MKREALDPNVAAWRAARLKEHGPQPSFLEVIQAIGALVLVWLALYDGPIYVKRIAESLAPGLGSTDWTALAIVGALWMVANAVRKDMKTQQAKLDGRSADSGAGKRGR